MKLQTRLREARIEYMWTQHALEAHAGLAPTLVSQYETGQRVPSIENACKLADALGVSLDWLVGRE